MLVFGLISTAFDLLLIFFLMFVFQVEPGLFRTAWFVESSISEIIVTFSIRTRHPFFQSKPGKLLLWSSLIIILGVIGFTYTALGGTLFEFVQMPWQVVGVIASVLVLYFATAEIAKRIFFSRNEI
jgi:P-type Mg2+ transporter